MAPGVGEFRRAVVGDGPAVASVFTAARALMSYLPALHSAEEDIAFFSEQVLPSSIVTVAESSEGVVIGFSAMKEDWLDHLYVVPSYQRHGIGSALLRAAMNDHPTRLSLWVFEENRGAQSLYSSFGFRVVERTDGSRNEERQPDVRMVWAGQLLG